MRNKNTCLWHCKHEIDLERDECLERSNYSAEFRKEAIATRVKQMHGNLNRYIYLDVPEEFLPVYGTVRLKLPWTELGVII